MSRYELPAGKRVTIYRSGDMHYPGATLTVNPMHIKNLENFLNQVTLKVDPSWGAVRSIHTPNTGTVLNSLQDLSKQGQYVAAGSKGFVSVPGGYGNAGKPGFSRKKFMNQKVIHRRVLPKLETLSLYLFKNGVKEDTPVHFRAREKDLQSWDSFLYKLSEKLRLSQGPVTRLYTLEGRIIKSSEQLIHNGVYVAAASNEAFRTIHYGDHHLENATSSTSLAGAGKDTREPARAKQAKPAEKGLKPKIPFKRTVQKRKANIEEQKKYSSENENLNVEIHKKVTLPRVKKQPPVVSKPLLVSNEAPQLPSTIRNSEQQRLPRQDSENTTSSERRAVYDLPDRIPEASDLRSVDYLNLQSPRPQSSTHAEHISHTPTTSRPTSPQSHMEYTRSRASSLYSYHGDTIAEEIEDVRTSRHSSPRFHQEYIDDTISPRVATRTSQTDSGNASLLSDEDGTDTSFRDRPESVFLDRPDSVFRAKESRPATTIIEVDYDTDDGGVFKSKNNTDYVRGAKEILDSTETKIELPLDMVEANEVQEEVY